MKGQHQQPGSPPAQAVQRAGAGWVDLARAAGYEGDETPEPETLAQLINLSPLSLQIGPNLYAIVHQTILEPGVDPATTAQLHALASRFLVGLNIDVLASALRSQSNSIERKRLLHAAVDVLSPAALRTLAQALTSAPGQSPSPALDMLLSKLELQASRAAGSSQPEVEAWRRLVHALVETIPEETDGRDPLESRRHASVPDEVRPEPERVLQLALESGAIGRIVWDAVSALAGGSDVRSVLDMLKAAPENSRTAALIGQQFASPARLTLLLREDPVDFEAVDALLRHLDLAAAEPLLDELVNSSSRATRRGILDRLARFGPAIEPLIVPRLSDDRWFVLRNMLHVLNEANCPVQRVPLVTYQNHADPRVRREAVQLLLRDSATRDRALAGALRDSDPTIVQIGLKAARAGLPEAAATILAKRIVDADFPPEFRAPALQLLSRSGAPHALDALLRFVQAQDAPGSRPGLQARSSEMLAALRSLARGWSHDGRTQALLRLAADSSDPLVREAARTPQTDARGLADDELA